MSKAAKSTKRNRYSNQIKQSIEKNRGKSTLIVRSDSGKAEFDVSIHEGKKVIGVIKRAREKVKEISERSGNGYVDTSPAR